MKAIFHRSIQHPLKSLVAMLLLFITAQGCTSQSVLSSPDQAVDTLVAALREDNQRGLNELFGSKSDQLIRGDDPAIDREDVERFLEAYDQKHRLVEQDDGSLLLVVGETEWPFPVPIVEDKNGWVFDTESGIEEVTNRRVGRNEDSAVQVCLAIVDAQQDYMTSDPDGDGLLEYARKFFSDPGRKNGLYWETPQGQPLSPLGPLIARAQSEGYSLPAPGESQAPRPYHGYRYHMLMSQGPNAAGGEMNYLVGGRLVAGFGAIAYPAVYGSSGVKSFIVDQLGVIYERDLGKDTSRIARSTTKFDPGPGWVKVDPPPPTTQP